MVSINSWSGKFVVSADFPKEVQEFCSNFAARLFLYKKRKVLSYCFSFCILIYLFGIHFQLTSIHVRMIGMGMILYSANEVLILFAKIAWAVIAVNKIILSRK